MVICCGLLFVAILLFNLSSFAQTSAKWVAPPEDADNKNPLAGNTAVLQDAHKLYVSMCAPCHGYKGRGNGPVAGVLTTRPADHSSSAIQSESDGSLYWKITNGRGPMQSYKANLTDAQRWALVNYIRTLKSD